MQGYFMVIDYVNSLKPAPLFSHVFLKPPYPRTVDTLLHVLEKEFKLSVPDPMLAEVLQDAKANIGQKEVRHVLVDGKHQRDEGVIDTFNGVVAGQDHALEIQEI